MIHDSVSLKLIADRYNKKPVKTQVIQELSDKAGQAAKIGLYHTSMYVEAHRRNALHAVVKYFRNRGLAVETDGYRIRIDWTRYDNRK